MPVRIHLRTDSSSRAEDAARLAEGKETMWHEADEVRDVDPANPGDCWRIRWKTSIEQEAAGTTEGPIAGYAICCIKCGEVHRWTTALNCGQPKREYKYVDRDGVEQAGTADFHSGIGSCWEWSGSAEDGTLTSSPSLHCLKEKGGCGYHGWLQNGVLSDG